MTVTLNTRATPLLPHVAHKAVCPACRNRDVPTWRALSGRALCGPCCHDEAAKRGYGVTRYGAAVAAAARAA